MGLNWSRVEAPFSFQISSKKEELVAPPILFWWILPFLDETYHSDVVMVDYVPTFFIEV